jgi:hypothetical protein
MLTCPGLAHAADQTVYDATDRLQQSRRIELNNDVHILGRIAAIEQRLQIRGNLGVLGE